MGGLSVSNYFNLSVVIFRDHYLVMSNRGYYNTYWFLCKYTNSTTVHLSVPSEQDECDNELMGPGTWSFKYTEIIKNKCVKDLLGGSETAKKFTLAELHGVLARLQFILKVRSINNNSNPINNIFPSEESKWETKAINETISLLKKIIKKYPYDTMPQYVHLRYQVLGV